MSFQFPTNDLQNPKTQSKAGFIVLVILLCFVASSVVRSIVKERLENTSKAQESVEASLPQLGFGAPAIVVRTENDPSNSQKYLFEKSVSELSDVKVEAALSPETKKVGKKEIVAYSSEVTISGKVDNSLLVKNTYVYIPIKSNVVISDIKAEVINGDIRTPIAVAFAETSCCDIPHVYKTVEMNGIDIAKANASGSATLSLQFSAKGSTSLEFLPNGDYGVTVATNHSDIRISRSDIGTVDNKTVSFEIQKEFYEYYSTDDNSFDSIVYTSKEIPRVSLLSGVDDIRLIDRATKYALLVIVLTFACVFFFDLRRQLVSNIFQYFLVGLSLVMFYLLTLALGEYIGFTLAYALASIVTAVMNGWYTASMFNSNKAGSIIGVAVLVLYAILYGILRLESVSFLAGTIILYTVLALFMVASRKMNKKIIG